MLTDKIRDPPHTAFLRWTNKGQLSSIFKLWPHLTSGKAFAFEPDTTATPPSCKKKRKNSYLKRHVLKPWLPMITIVTTSFPGLLSVPQESFHLHFSYTWNSNNTSESSRAYAVFTPRLNIFFLLWLMNFLIFNIFFLSFLLHDLSRPNLYLADSPLRSIQILFCLPSLVFNCFTISLLLINKMCVRISFWLPRCILSRKTN